jgi:2-polyprenyl-3-methyl-5-hydroxy-6-metoxy-1,4-benzoquinol methylase
MDTSRSVPRDPSLPPGAQVSARWAAWRAEVDLVEYEHRWRRLEDEGVATHGEADLVWSYRPRSVLDAGCGMGRVAIELARRGVDTVGVDLDEDLLEVARRLAPEQIWEHRDLADVDLQRRFDVVVMAGNVMLFCRPEVRHDIVAALAAHLEPDGRLVMGSSLERRAGGFTFEEYDSAAASAGLVLEDRWSTWERGAWSPEDRYAVSVHRRA